jgi:hypothetical protein
MVNGMLPKGQGPVTNFAQEGATRGIPLSDPDETPKVLPMGHVIAATPPPGSLIAPFAGMPGHYADAFVTDAAPETALHDAILAFYTNPLFRAERLVLSLAGLRSSDADVARLAGGTAEQFAALQVEARRPDEIVLADTSGRTKSWLAVAGGGVGTQLWFGSVIVPKTGAGRPAPGPFVTALIGPHRLYSRALLAAAARRLAKAP